MATIFPKWLNMVPTLLAIGGGGATMAVVVGTWYWATPDYFEVGYMPTQPGSGFNHQIHAGKLGMDCRYCHTKVEESNEANIPAVATCIGCHAEERLATAFDPGEKVAFIREAYAKDHSVEWRRVHKLPDYVRNFPHAAHINAGVSCYSCHGQITAMPVVFQAEGLGMGWCLDCHRGVEKNPEKYLVPPDKVTNLFWVEQHLATVKKGDAQARKLQEQLRESPPQHCGACHY
ncbi:MAG: cytochrome c3 family protein [Phycisphaeraceae bacterium]|nr:cytochrome c3 family protein [Phycisphaeraceae bacterium]MBX3367490.1 cytochrome c3 family protein [Phycisphaeraceae bacterium]